MWNSLFLVLALSATANEADGAWTLSSFESAMNVRGLSASPARDEDALMGTDWDRTEAAGSRRTGFYGKVSGGVTSLFDGDLDREEGGTLTPGDAEYDLGVAFSGGMGYRWSNGFSLELEGIYRRNELDSLEVAGVDAASGGDFASLTFYLNALYAFETESRWTPYVGLGLGWVEEIDVDVETVAGELGYDSSGFGYQAMVGVEYEFESGLGLFGEARVFGATGFDLESEDGTGVEYDGDYLGLSLSLGLTYRF